MKSSVPCPAIRRDFAASKIFLRSATPEKTAERGSKCSEVCSARSRASVVLPQPGGPQRIIEEIWPEATMRPMGASGARRCCWPTISSSRLGRSRSASGRGAWDSNNPVTANSSIDTQRAGFPVSAESDVPAAVGGVERLLQVGDLVEVAAVDRDDDVPLPEPEAHGGGTATDLDDHHALPFAIELQLLGQRRREVRDRGTRKRLGTLELRLIGRRRLGRGNEPDPQIRGLALADDREGRGFADIEGGQAEAQAARVLHQLAVDGRDDVAALQPGLAGGAAGIDLVDDDAGRMIEPQSLGHVGADGLAAGADPGPVEMAALELGGEKAGDHIGRDGEADADRPAGL